MKMKNSRMLLGTLLLAIMLPVSAIAMDIDRSKAPEPAPAPELNMGDYQSFELDNGLRVYVVENKKVPRISVALVLDRDPIVEGDAAGYIGATGQLLRRGTKTKNKAQLDEAIDFLGANVFTTANGFTASALSKYTRRLVRDFVRDRAQSLFFPRGAGQNQDPA